jgi:hypothetical protein
VAQVAPRFFGKTLVLRSKLRFIVDHDLAVDLTLYLPAGTLSPYSLGFDRRPSRQEVARLCPTDLPNLSAEQKARLNTFTAGEGVIIRSASLLE